jgi:hypothetical protein
VSVPRADEISAERQEGGEESAENQKPRQKVQDVVAHSSRGRESIVVILRKTSFARLKKKKSFGVFEKIFKNYNPTCRENVRLCENPTLAFF